MAQFFQFLGIGALQVQYRLQLLHRFRADAFFPQFGIYVLQSDFIHLVDGDGNVRQAIRVADGFGDACQDFPVVHQQPHADVQAAVHLVYHLHQFRLVQQRVAAHHVHVALVELPVASFLRTVCPPHGLYLVALEGEGEFILVLHHEAGERHRQVIAQPLFRNPVRQPQAVAFQQFAFRHVADEIPGVQYLEQQFVALLAVLSHQGGEVLHGGRFQGHIAVQFEYTLDGVENIIAFHHDFRRKIPGSFGYGRCLCHIMI